MKRDQELYAPAAPFAEAMRRWLDAYRAQMRARPFHAITAEHRPNRPRPGSNDRYPGLETLARDAGFTSKALRRYLDGEAQWIGLDTADRLAMALNVPLCVLADDFRPAGETTLRDRARRQEQMA